MPTPFIERLAGRVPVVIFAGTPHEKAVDVVTADNLSGTVAVVTHLIRDHGRRRARKKSNDYCQHHQPRLSEPGEFQFR